MSVEADDLKKVMRPVSVKSGRPYDRLREMVIGRNWPNAD